MLCIDIHVTYKYADKIDTAKMINQIYGVINCLYYRQRRELHGDLICL